MPNPYKLFLGNQSEKKKHKITTFYFMRQEGSVYFSQATFENTAFLSWEITSIGLAKWLRGKRLLPSCLMTWTWCLKLTCWKERANFSAHSLSSTSSLWRGRNSPPPHHPTKQINTKKSFSTISKRLQSLGWHTICTEASEYTCHWVISTSLILAPILDSGILKVWITELSIAPSIWSLKLFTAIGNACA